MMKKTGDVSYEAGVPQPRHAHWTPRRAGGVATADFWDQLKPVQRACLYVYAARICSVLHMNVFVRLRRL